MLRNKALLISEIEAMMSDEAKARVNQEALKR